LRYFERIADYFSFFYGIGAVKSIKNTGKKPNRI